MFLATLSILTSLTLAMPELGPQPADRIVFAASSASGTSMHFEFLVAPDRRILSCRMLHVVPADAPVQEVCPRLTGQKVAKAGRGPDGKPVHAIFDFVFTLDRVVKYTAPPDRRIEVSDLPGDAAQATVAVAFMVSEDGLVSGCQRLREDTQALVDLACSYLDGTRWEQRLSRSGEPVAYLNAIVVELAELRPPSD